MLETLPSRTALYGDNSYMDYIIYMETIIFTGYYTKVMNSYYMNTIISTCIIWIQLFLHVIYGYYYFYMYYMDNIFVHVLYGYNYFNM